MGERISTELVIAVSDAFVTRGFLGKFVEMRARAARDKLFERLRGREISVEQAADQDELVSIVHRYMHTVSLGVAERQLELLADISAGKLMSTPIRADDFSHWAELVAGLSTQELRFVAGLARRFDEISTTSKLADELAREFAQSVSGPGRLFEDFEEYLVVGAALTRTGLVRATRLIGSGNIYRPSSKLRKLVELARIGRGEAFRDAHD